MVFHVRIDVALPADLPEGERDALLADERRRGEELVKAGLIRGIWRIPGKLANRRDLGGQRRLRVARAAHVAARLAVRDSGGDGSRVHPLMAKSNV